MKNNKGFTLVELLVVIAIIAVLSAIAIVNLNTARNKGNDASVKANLAALPAAGEVFYDDHSNAYTGFCTDPAIDGVKNNVSTFDCSDAADEWVAWAYLTGVNEWYCIDSTGYSTSTYSGTATSTHTACQ